MRAEDKKISKNSENSEKSNKKTKSNKNGSKTPKKGITDKTKGGKGKNKKGKNKDSTKSNTAKVAKKNQIGKYIKNYTENCTEIRISFTITFYPGKLKELIKSGSLEKDLKLVTKINLNNMHLFDERGKIKKFDSYGSIIKHYANIRLELYQKRKDYLLDKWRKEMDILKWKVKFILDVRSGKILYIDIRNNTSKKNRKY